MSKIQYANLSFREKSLDLIEIINNVIDDYSSQGFRLTLRQVYYQLVARDYISNSERSYKNIGNLISNARLAGYIDWYAIEDRTRGMRSNSHWDKPEDVIQSAKWSYMLDRWENQPNYVEVWVEKDALVGIVGQICEEFDVPYFSCRGYTSQTAMWDGAQRFINKEYKEERVILHLGDHDPSGIDMTRDIRERMAIFNANVKVKRIALNREQIEKFNPPPNPTKVSDARAGSYISKYEHECWELDALEPREIRTLIKNEVNKLIDLEEFNRVSNKEYMDKKYLDIMCEHYDEIISIFKNID